MESKPNFYAIIPAHVRYCKDIEPAAKLLYGELTALASQEGYCWASNKYLSNLYDVDARTIRRWLEALKEKEFIDIEYTEEGKNQRKIWILPDIKKFNTTGQKCPGGVTKVSRGVDKNAHNINTRINTEDHKNVCPEPPVEAPVMEKKVEKQAPNGIKSSLEFDDVIRKSLNLNMDWKTSEIKEAWNILCSYQGYVSDLWQFIVGTIKNLRQKATQEKFRKGNEKCQKSSESIQTHTQKTPNSEKIPSRQIFAEFYRWQDENLKMQHCQIQS